MSVLGTAEVPQADSLRQIRLLIECLAAGVYQTGALSAKTQISPRHVRYGLNAARALGFLEGHGPSVRLSALGTDLLKAGVATPAESDAFRRAILASRVMKAIAPTLLFPKTPSADELADRIQAATVLSPITARRRAQTLLAWRRQLLQGRLDLSGEASATATEAPQPMSIDVQQITDEQRKRILAFEEGHFLDLKSKLIAPGKLTKFISGFANADGGELYIGIEEENTRSQKRRKWQGFIDPEAANGHIQAFERLFPLGTDYTYGFLSHATEPGLLLHVQIRKSATIVISSEKGGIPFIRRGAQCLPVDTDDARRQLERNKGITSFESETVLAGKELITNSSTVIDFMLQVIPDTEPEPWLLKQQLIRVDKPVVAGILLFADLPQAVLPKRCGVKLYRYKTDRSHGSRETLVDQPQTIEGCAYAVIAEAVKKTQSIINDVPVLTASGLEPVRYPIETLHEVITNAVLHRDYSIADDVHVRIYDNRVEVESPGRLPAHITPRNILSERFARNGQLVRLINKFPNPPNKDIGEGLNTAFEAMRRLKLKEPTISETETSVVVIIRHERLASPEDLVMEYLESHESITNGVARKLTGIESENAMKSVFYRLRDRKLLEQVPELSGSKAAWRRRKAKGK